LGTAALKYGEKRILTALTLILLTWRIRWAPNNARKWQTGFNTAFKVLNALTLTVANFNTGKQRAACCHMKYPEWKADKSCQTK